MLSGVAAQTADDARRLSELGAKDVMVVGNLKFDVNPPTNILARARHLHELLGERFVFVAASTREGEEALILDTLSAIDVPELLLVLIPRHPQRFDDVARLLEQRGLRFERRSAGQPVSAETQVLLGDSMGELAAYYSVANLALIGGSLLPLGGQNLIEAAMVGCPILIGPHTWNFAEVSELAVACGAARRVNDGPQLAETINQLAKAPDELARMSEACEVYAGENRGATARVLAMISTPTDAQAPI
jgi:3-deoxy-D-manno-octulosonic-acid transferase